MQPIVTTDLFCDGFLFGSIFGFCLCITILIISYNHNQERENDDMFVEEDNREDNNKEDIDNSNNRI